jgi:hypothetical protein
MPPSASVERQLAEVYSLVEELRTLTDRIESRVDSVIETLNTESDAGNGAGQGTAGQGTGSL